MKQTLVWILVAANVSLAGTLAWRGLGANTAHAAQVRQPEQGKYVLIPGESTSSSVSIIYVFDANNRRLGAIAPDSKDMLTTMPTIALDPVFEAASNTPPAETPGRPRPARPGSGTNNR